MINITITGEAKSGKSTISQIILDALNNEGIPAQINNTEGDYVKPLKNQHLRILSLRKKITEPILIEEKQLSRQYSDGSYND